ncbi:MAG: thioesterase family protein [Caulobacteraceae bacterium]|nr:thioesterase family protein [Caulobacteraceae bacterium]
MSETATPEAGSARACYYEAVPEGYVAQPPATGPWDPRAQSGVALAGLMAHLVETDPEAAGLDIARFQLEILRPAPFGEPCQVRRSVLRSGQRIRLVEIELSAEGRPLVRAMAARLRIGESPDLSEPGPPADPDAIEAPPFRRRSARSPFASKLLAGGLEQLGPGEAWFRYDADIVAGFPITPFVAAAMITDKGSGLGSVFNWREYSYANIDLSMHLTRAPRDPWIHLAAETVSQGLGRALAKGRLSDPFGPFAYTHQTLFIDPRG